MKRVILTGAAGVVGANLARRLLREGHEVRLEDAEGVARVVSGIRPGWIFRLAAHGAYSWETDGEPTL